ncbi:MAG: FKBP-type peptidyl-prolyl cis-trans isomerase, partial [Ignavibacteria bacterium]
KMKKIIILLSIIFSVSLFSQSGDTISTASGLKYIVLKNGKGKKSETGKVAEVHYTGWLVDGKKFDSSRDRKQTLEFILGTSRIIKGWNEGVALMKVGDEFRFILPPELGYGDKGSGDVIPPDATLIFDIELINVFSKEIHC